MLAAWRKFGSFLSMRHLVFFVSGVVDSGMVLRSVIRFRKKRGIVRRTSSPIRLCSKPKATLGFKKIFRLNSLVRKGVQQSTYVGVPMSSPAVNLDWGRRDVLPVTGENFTEKIGVNFSS